ncbi:Acyl-CoA synthetase (AMP-forming)/AMP-acid ligase II [Parafrankia irregularis]|uniref:Acyl-CoA synthetase (AMP-forming)/AMP-acid ligase II n=1 Tax=Parafrankia irregularis TaxID=795642 RepID=A0A0S4QWK1_9ACTN|nr:MULTISPECIES: fatty acid--CoA ligase family protein [Parafrankia]MBE3199994.1 long-chain fatty acid--CoA ligase [Parafrankia sp. CH37]CUU59260.1 Acyl-CoA synthetase (AMP-forming)/AMP-acid ligase II [Parafrankia irregularis]
MSVATLLAMAAAGHGERTAIGTRADGLTFAELEDQATGGAFVLRGTGARSVAYLGLNGPGFTVALLAAAVADLPFTPLNYRLPTEELRDLLARLDAPFLIADGDLRARLAPHAHAAITTQSWLAEAATPRVAPDPLPPAADSPAVVLFTSGTTSAPKAVILRNSHLFSYVTGTVEFSGAGEDDAALVSVPPYHVAGVGSVLSNLYAGRRTLHLAGFDPALWLELVQQERVSSAMLVPTMLARIVEHLAGRPADVPTLTSLAYGGARMPAPVLRRALAAFPTTGFVNAYGLTETSSTIALLGPEDHRSAVSSADPAVQARLGSAGQAVPGVTLQIRAEDGTPLAPGELGELWVRGGQVSGEYAGLGSVLDADGWFPTRDQAHLDPDGYLFITGRGDDTIIRGGENVAPAEIEDVLVAHPEVRDAAVVGVPDDEWGERIAAAVVVKPGSPLTADGLRDWARGRLRSSRTPDQVALLTELPYTPTGKLLRRQVRADLMTLAGVPAGTPVAR